MLDDLSPAARALAAYMSELSEAAWHAAWMDGLEVELWRAVVDGPRRYGQLDLRASHIARLKELAEAAGGWVVFDDEAEETLVPMATWQARFEAAPSRRYDSGFAR